VGFLHVHHSDLVYCTGQIPQGTMAWEERDEFVDRDLMGVHGDVLFADPLGVRGAKPNPAAVTKSTTSRSQPQEVHDGRRNRTKENSVDAEDATELFLRPDTKNSELGDKREEDDSSWLGSVLWSVFAGGKQCCSMRDRTRPQDQEAAKRAAETGRPPPRSSFPRPRGRGDIGGSGGREDSDSPRDMPPSLVKPPQKEPRKKEEFVDEDSADDLHRPTGDRPANRGSPSPPIQQESPPQRVQENDVPKPPPTLAAPPANVNRSAAPPKPRTMPIGWEWPAWCLNFKAPCIEVYVDDEENNEGRWVEAEPQSRVVDKAGRDAYLCVEYEWDGEFYVQDFGPHQVRRRGQTSTVADEAMEKAARGRGDTGGGVSAFLNED